MRLIAAATGLVLVAASLRSPISSLGAVLLDVQRDLGFSSSVAGVLTALPLLTFGVVGSAVPSILRRVPMHRALVASAALVGLGTVGRGLGTLAWLLVGTVAALVGIAVANVLLPAFVHAVSAERAGWLTGAYVSVMQIGTAAGALVAVPVSRAAGSWTMGLAIWGVPALLGVTVWSMVDLRALAHRVDVGTTRTGRTLSLLRDRVARGLLGVFAIQASVAYVMMGWLPSILREAGMSAEAAGSMVALAWAVSIPTSFLLPTWLAARPDQRAFVWFVAIPSSIAVVGLVVAPRPLAALWASFLGLGLASFAVSLLLMTLRSSSPAITQRVSAFAQGGGYLLAFPVAGFFGVLRDLTGGWTASLVLLLAAQGLLVTLGRRAGKGKVSM